MRADMMTMTLPRASAITCRKTPGVWVVNYLMGRDLDEQYMRELTPHVHVGSVVTMAMVTSRLFSAGISDLRCDNIATLMILIIDTDGVHLIPTSGKPSFSGSLSARSVKWECVDLKKIRISLADCGMLTTDLLIPWL